MLVANADQFRDVVERLRQFLPVTQLLPPSLAMISISPGQESITNIPGVTVYLDEVPSAVLNDLSPREQLFVQAWQARRDGKARLGDGLPWDAPGFTPPG